MKVGTLGTNAEGTLMPFFRKYRYRLLAHFGLLAVSFLFTLSVPVVLNRLIDLGVLRGDFDDIAKYSALLVLSYAIIVGLRVVISIQSSTTLWNVNLDLKYALCRHAFALPPRYLKERMVGDLNYTINRLPDEILGLFVMAGELALNVATALAYLIMLFGFNAMLAGLVSASLILFYFLDRDALRRRHGTLMEMFSAEEKAEGAIVESLNGISTIRAFAGSERRLAGIRALLKEHLLLALRQGRMAVRTETLSNLFSKVLPVVVLCLGSYLAAKGRLSVGQLVAFFSLSGILLGSLDAITLQMLNYGGGKAAIAKLRAFMALETEDAAAGKRVDSIERIEFDRVTLVFDEGKRGVRDVSFAAERGMALGIAGPNGSGKSTIANLLLKQLHPQSGTVLLNGGNLEEIAANSFLPRTGYVSQDVFLFNDTIMANIRLGSPEASDGQVEAAIAKCHLGAFVSGLADGASTPVGNLGSAISGGEKQRIALARALVGKPDLIVLDEPASGLDFETERAMLENIAVLKERAIVVVITHNPRELALCDRVLVLDGGETAEYGEYVDLERRSEYIRGMRTKAEA